jgi:hypothetical protein
MLGNMGFVDTHQELGERTTCWNESWLCQTRGNFQIIVNRRNLTT